MYRIKEFRSYNEADRTLCMLTTEQRSAYVQQNKIFMQSSLNTLFQQAFVSFSK